jgi:hypothetical protein
MVLVSRAPVNEVREQLELDPLTSTWKLSGSGATTFLALAILPRLVPQLWYDPELGACSTAERRAGPKFLVAFPGAGAARAARAANRDGFHSHPTPIRLRLRGKPTR